MQFIGLTGTQTKYCGNCGKEREMCECKEKDMTISITVPGELVSTLTSLTSLIPKIQTSDNSRCNKCGHTTKNCACK